MLKNMIKMMCFFTYFFDLTNVFKTNEIINIFRNVDFSPFVFRLKINEFKGF